MKKLLHTGRMCYPAKNGDCGYDLVVQQNTYIYPGEFIRVQMSSRIAIPDGYWGLFIARSSTNSSGKLLILPGVIDSGYRGELFALVHNLSNESVFIEAGSRICQIILMPMVVFPLVQVNHLPNSERGWSGMGSTGK